MKDYKIELLNLNEHMLFRVTQMLKALKEGYGFDFEIKEWKRKDLTNHILRRGTYKYNIVKLMADKKPRRGVDVLASIGPCNAGQHPTSRLSELKNMGIVAVHDKVLGSKGKKNMNLYRITPYGTFYNQTKLKDD